MNYTDHIKDCISKTKETIKTNQIPDDNIVSLCTRTNPHPMSSPNSQYFLNLLCKLPKEKKTKYFEVGVAWGASYFAAAHDNKGVFYGIDNWSKYGLPWGANLENIDTQIKRYSGKNRQFIFFEQDCWKLDLKEIEDKINIFFYDGDHSFESHKKILTHFDTILDNEFILIVDDYYSDDIGKDIREATKFAIEDSKFESQSEFFIEKDKKYWHNGFYLTHLRRENV